MTTAPAPKKRSRFFRVLRALAVLVLLLVAFFYFVYLVPLRGSPFDQSSRHGRVPLTPPWALECWLWEDDVNTEAYENELLDGFAKYDLPVRTLLIDSPWSDRYNDFKVDEERYPEPEKFFRSLKDRGYRIVLWMTCMVNSSSKDTRVRDSQAFYDEARTNGYLASDGYQWKWWKGKGGFIDYTSPEAMKWWTGLQKQVMDWGCDGWKLDGCDTFFSSKVGALLVPYGRTHAGRITTRQYMDLYSRVELTNGLARNPQFIVLVRALDQGWHPEGFSPLDAATVTWVGDNNHTWGLKDRGIQGALTDILGSASLGYCVVGSDVAGYHGRSNPDDIGANTSALLANWSKPATTGLVVGQASRLPGHAGETPGATGGTPAPLPQHSPPVAGTNDFGSAADNTIAPNIYIRWAEFSTFCGLFLNGGHGERRLWKRTWPELEIIRKFSWLHTELVPYMYSYVVECHNGAPPLMRPQEEGKYHYLFGNELLVAPIYADKLDWTVTLPPGRWRYLFHDDEVTTGPAEVKRDFPLDEFPVFVRDGAVIPLNVTRPYTGFGDTNSAGFTTWLVYPEGKSQFTLWHPESHPKPEKTTLTVDSGSVLKLEFSGKHEPHILRIYSQSKPTHVALDGTELPEGSAWQFDASHHRLIIRTRDYAQGSYQIR